jgi:hypothetical protein
MIRASLILRRPFGERAEMANGSGEPVSPEVRNAQIAPFEE